MSSRPEVLVRILALLQRKTLIETKSRTLKCLKWHYSTVRSMKNVAVLTEDGQALVDCVRKKSILCFQQCSYFLEIMPKLCYFLKIMLSVTQIMLLRIYTNFKENEDHQQLNSINFDFNKHSCSPPSSLTVFSVANTHVRISKSQMINK